MTTLQSGPIAFTALGAAVRADVHAVRFALKRMARVGLVERQGSGSEERWQIPRPPVPRAAEFETVVAPSAAADRERDQVVLEIVGRGPQRIGEIAHALGGFQEEVRARLQSLEQQGHVTVDGQANQRKWRITIAGAQALRQATTGSEREARRQYTGLDTGDADADEHLEDVNVGDPEDDEDLEVQVESTLDPTWIPPTRSARLQPGPAHRQPAAPLTEKASGTSWWTEAGPDGFTDRGTAREPEMRKTKQAGMVKGTSRDA